MSSDLKWLYLHGNQLSGQIPPELGSLSKLRDLWLSLNRLSGEIPPELGSLFNLRWLGLEFNQLSGEIPLELGSLFNLERLDLEGNQLSGEIPPELGSLSNLEDLRLGGRGQLTGCIPEGLESVPSDLTRLGLPFCMVTSTADTSTGTPASDRAALVALYNATAGPSWKDNTSWLSDAPVGEWHGVTTDDNARVTELDLSDNQLSGEIPAELGSLSNLESLTLHGNRLSGEIPLQLGRLSNLESLDLSDNQLSGEIPPELDRLSKLKSMDLSDSQLSGEIPSELGRLSKLQSLDLSDNQLSGDIPAELGNLSNLEELYLGGSNQLTGCMPYELRNVPGDFAQLGLALCRVTASTGTPASDRAALVALHNGTAGASWKDSTSWLGDAPIGEWHGVTTDDSGRVIEVDLSDNQLSGEMPSETGQPIKAGKSESPR